MFILEKQILHGYLALLFNHAMISLIRLNCWMVRWCKDMLITSMNMHASDYHDIGLHEELEDISPIPVVLKLLEGEITAQPTLYHSQRTRTHTFRPVSELRRKRCGNQ